jgi:hypothetical protein
MPYLINRMKRLFTEDIWLRISPFERISDRTVIILHRRTWWTSGASRFSIIWNSTASSPTSSRNYRLDTSPPSNSGKRKLSFAEYKNLRTLYG